MLTDRLYCRSNKHRQLDLHNMQLNRVLCKLFHNLPMDEYLIKGRKNAKTRNRCNQAPHHLAQDTTWEGKKTH